MRRRSGGYLGTHCVQPGDANGSSAWAAELAPPDLAVPTRDRLVLRDGCRVPFCAPLQEEVDGFLVALQRDTRTFEPHKHVDEHRDFLTELLNCRHASSLDPRGVSVRGLVPPRTVHR